MRLGLQASRGVGDQDVDAAGSSCLKCIEDHGRRIGARLLSDDRHAIAPTPRFELLDRSGTKGISRGEHHFEALRRQASCELAYRRSFARAVDANHEDRERPLRCVDLQRLRAGCEQLDERFAQRAEQRLEVLELLAFNAAPEIREDSFRRIDAYICRQEARFELIQDFGIDRATGQKIGEIVGKPGVALVETCPQARDEPAPRVIGRSYGSRIGALGEHRCGFA